MSDLSDKSSKYQTIFIVGPTASGKSTLALDLAKALSAEIICADSQTIRRSMDIGTAKPTISEQKMVQHHLVDIIEPYEPYNLAMFLESARNTINILHKRGVLAVIVGGTGLYIDGLYFNYDLPQLSCESVNDTDINNLSIHDLQAEIVKRGYSLPQNTSNQRHLINVLKRGGQEGTQKTSEEKALIIGLYPGREQLIKRINSRVEAMFENGFIDEVKKVIEKYGRPPKNFDAIGYKIALRYLDREITEIEAKELLKIAHRQYAKRQMTWFKRNQDIVWMPNGGEAKKYLSSVLGIHF